MQIDLTKSAKKSIAKIYKAYCERIASKESKGSAARFSLEKHKDLALDVRDDLEELQNAGLLTIDIIGGFELTKKAIVFMENLKGETIKEWLSFLSQFIP